MKSRSNWSVHYSRIRMQEHDWQSQVIIVEHDSDCHWAALQSGSIFYRDAIKITYKGIIIADYEWHEN